MTNDNDLQAPTTGDVESLIDMLERDASPVLGDCQRLAAAQMLRALQPRLDAGVGPNDVGPCYFYERDFYPLSNFSAFRVRWHSIDFPTSEHAYQWAKFGTMSRDIIEANSLVHEGAREEVARAVLTARSAHEAFKLAEVWRQLRRPDWTDVRVDMMRRIVTAKAMQHEYVRRKLWQSGNRLLVENSWRDDFWGWGPARNGQNWLGLLWTDVREKLRDAGSFGAYEATGAA
jgi:ribA/ribD-fused uncharacterized protein